MSGTTVKLIKYLLLGALSGAAWMVGGALRLKQTNNLLWLTAYGAGLGLIVALVHFAFRGWKRSSIRGFVGTWMATACVLLAAICIDAEMAGERCSIFLVVGYLILIWWASILDYHLFRKRDNVRIRHEAGDQHPDRFP